LRASLVSAGRIVPMFSNQVWLIKIVAADIRRFNTSASQRFNYPMIIEIGGSDDFVHQLRPWTVDNLWSLAYESESRRHAKEIPKHERFAHLRRSYNVEAYRCELSVCTKL